MTSLPEEQLDESDASPGRRPERPPEATGDDAGPPASGAGKRSGDASAGQPDSRGIPDTVTPRRGSVPVGSEPGTSGPEGARARGAVPVEDGGGVPADERAGGEHEGGEEPPEPRAGLTPREARRVRAITAAVFMVGIAVGLLVQLSGETSLMTLALYGVGLVLSGVAIKLSYAGRTRVSMAVIVLGFGLVVAEQVSRWL